MNWFTVCTAAALLASFTSPGTSHAEGRWAPGFGSYIATVTPRDVTEWNGQLWATRGFYTDVRSNDENLHVWDGSEWTRMQGPFDGLDDQFAQPWRQVTHVDVFDGKLVAVAHSEDWGSGFPRLLLNRVATWDGEFWAPLGQGFRGQVQELFVHAGQVFAWVRYATNAHRLVAWNGLEWSAVTESEDDWLGSFYSDGSDLLAAGSLSNATGSSLHGIFSWDGNSWREIAPLPPGPVRCLHRFEGDLIAGSEGRHSGDQMIYRFDGLTWAPLGGGIPGPPETRRTVNSVRAMRVVDGRLLVTGRFTEAGGVPALNIAVWDGVQWKEPGGGLRGVGAGFADWEGDLLAFGGFGYAGDHHVNGLARWTGAGWSELRSGLGIQGSPSQLVPVGSELWVAGYVESAGGKWLQSPVIWDGGAWRGATDAGDYANVDAVADHHGVIYAAGSFRYTAGAEVLTSPLGRFEDGGWTAVPGDWGSAKGTALCSWGSALALGVRAYEDGESSNALVIWDGGIRGRFDAGDLYPGIAALAVYQDRLVVAGTFLSIDGNSATMVAAYDGSSWDRLGGGVGGEALSLAVDGDDLYVGGTFNVVGPLVPAKSIARWDGSSWSALGAGFSTERTDRSKVAIVDDLVIHHGALYATGRFESSGETPVYNLARWDGATWSGVGGGLGSASSEWGGHGQALASWNGDLFVAGRFSRAGGIEAAGFARWISPQGNPPSAGVALRSIVPNPLNPSTTITYAVSRTDRVRVAIYDARGRHVAHLVDGTRESGEYEVQWSGLDDEGSLVASGVYYVRVNGAGGTAGGKVTVVK